MYHFRITAASYDFLDGSLKLFIHYGELAGARTQDPRLSSGWFGLIPNELISAL